MKGHTRKSRRGANLAAARAVKAQRDAERIGRTLRKGQRKVALSHGAYIVRETLATNASLASLQRRAEQHEPGASFTLSAFERLAERRTGAHRGIVAAMREDNAGRTSARLAWPDTADRTPDHWQRRIVAPSGWQRMEWRIVLVREGAAAAAAWAEQHGAAWEYPASGADRVPVVRPDVVLATTTADRAALAAGIA